MGEVLIRAEHVKKYFPVKGSHLFAPRQFVKAVDDVSLTVHRGEIVGLIGESGSGKTTLARVILGLIKPGEGKVLVDGCDIAAASGRELKQLRQQIAVVFQDPMANLNPKETVESSIMRPMIIHGVPRSEAKQRAAEAIRKVKLDERYLKSYPHQLSGGQLQRIAIARALVLEPKLMILDEPTSALDISVQAQVFNLLLDLQEEKGLTYLMISHDLNAIRYVSDKIAVMYLGKLVEYGPTEEVFSHPRHPYTRGLMSAAPDMDPSHRGRDRQRLQGEPGSLIKTGPGCRFRERCPYAKPECAQSCPELREVTAEHLCACFKDAE